MFAKTTDFNFVSGAIDDALRSLKVAGSLLLRESYAGPWSVAVPDNDKLCLLLGLPRGTRAVAFHLVEFGHCEVRIPGRDSVLLRAGDMAVCFGGSSHVIAVGARSVPQTIANLLAGKPNQRHPDVAGRAADTSLICGVFHLQYADFNPLVAALPDVLHTSLSRSGELHNLSGVARMLADEIERSPSGGGYVMERLVEVLCAEAIRACIETAPRNMVGWLRGVKDPVVGRAIASVHANPGADWSVSRLAGEVAMSPSRFSARFAESLGVSPMAYVTQWRMNVACRSLDASRVSVEQIAAKVGYESAAAFNRTFKKVVGLPPATWRVRHGRGQAAT